MDEIRPEAFILIIVCTSLSRRSHTAFSKTIGLYTNIRRTIEKAIVFGCTFCENFSDESPSDLMGGHVEYI